MAKAVKKQYAKKKRERKIFEKGQAHIQVPQQYTCYTD